MEGQKKEELRQTPKGESGGWGGAGTPLAREAAGPVFGDRGRVVRDDHSPPRGSIGM